MKKVSCKEISKQTDYGRKRVERGEKKTGERFRITRNLKTGPGERQKCKEPTTVSQGVKIDVGYASLRVRNNHWF